MKQITSIFLFSSFLLASCSTAPAMPESVPTLGAGFRYSIYGPAYDPGPAYWASVAERMTQKFPGSGPMGIWIIGDIEGNQAYLNFPGTSDDLNIIFGKTDDNEATLTYFDKHNIQVWLQVEPGDADMLKVIDLVLNRYKKHPCVIGFGVDVEWYHSKGDEAEGQPVTDAEAGAWVVAVRAHNPSYRLFLKHWDINWIPSTVRDGIVFVDDSQQFNSMQQMVDEFAVWGQHFAPAPVAFQYGYPDDKVWWGILKDPPADIGKAILAVVPNTSALYWVDFTVLDVFPPNP
jgi:hypothetical protein